VAVVKEGTVMFELAGIDVALMKDTLRKAGNKLSVKSRVVKKGDLAHD
jgi:large subunit ribosomal protein L16